MYMAYFSSFTDRKCSFTHLNQGLGVNTISQYWQQTKLRCLRFGCFINIHIINKTLIRIEFSSRFRLLDKNRSALEKDTIEIFQSAEMDMKAFQGLVICNENIQVTLCSSGHLLTHTLLRVKHSNSCCCSYQGLTYKRGLRLYSAL